MNNIITFLNENSAFISLLSSLSSIVALVVSVIALIQANRKSNLSLKYIVHGVDESGFSNKNGKGKLIFFSIEQDDYITGSRPGAELNLSLENSSRIVAKNPIINFKFTNMAVELHEYHKNWRGIDFAGNGTWTEVRWTSEDGTSVHKGIPLVLDAFHLNNSPFNKNEGFLHVILSADNMKTKKFKIPIEIKEY